MSNYSLSACNVDGRTQDPSVPKSTPRCSPEPREAAPCRPPPPAPDNLQLLVAAATTFFCPEEASMRRDLQEAGLSLSVCLPAETHRPDQLGAALLACGESAKHCAVAPGRRLVGPASTGSPSKVAGRPLLLISNFFEPSRTTSPSTPTPEAHSLPLRLHSAMFARSIARSATASTSRAASASSAASLPASARRSFATSSLLRNPDGKSEADRKAEYDAHRVYVRPPDVVTPECQHSCPG